MLAGLISIYRPNFTSVIVYMLQSTEYEPRAYLKWLVRVGDFNKVTYRRKLVKTKPARMLLGFLRLAIFAQIVIGLYLILAAGNHHENLMLGVAPIIVAPILWAYLIVVPLLLGRWFIINPSSWLKIRASRKIFARHPGVKIAVAGSYGKTSMKEMLNTVLAEGKKVAATPANKNVSVSHALFARRLKGDEEVLIIEYGEGAPGDVKRFARITKPDLAVITGLAPAHLDKYKTLKRAGQDIFSVAAFVGDQNTYVNGDSPATAGLINKNNLVYSSKGVDGWKASNYRIDIQGIRFDLANGKETIKVKSRLLGEHQVGPLAAVARIAFELGLSIKEIEAGISKIEPFEHRMSSYQLSGAWIIDDTYNGNIEGVRAGLALLKELRAKRKIYVTPGLVDQGGDEAKIHRQLGELIKASNPDEVVLMNHSVTKYISEGLDGFEGRLVIEDDPLEFYTNIDKFVAAGDLVLMQNDWPDNYN
jgi:UDP-N-acetylmuramoyl-tripeptide--D-alanyl-D-alanine ligase